VERSQLFERGRLYPSIADMAGLPAGSTPSRLTPEADSGPKCNRRCPRIVQELF
jgi:hypothetical protein